MAMKAMTLVDGSARHARAGTNSLGEQRYNGPAPPKGHGRHHYYFWVYALDEDLDLDLEPGLERRALLKRIASHVIEQARLIGTFKPESSRRGLRAAHAGATVTAIDFARRGASTLHD